MVKKNKKTVLVLNADSKAGNAACNSVESRGYNSIKIFRNNNDHISNSFSLKTNSKDEVLLLSNTLDAEGIKIDYLITCPAPDTDSTGAFSYNSHAVTNSLEWKNNFEQNLLAAAIFCDIFGAKMQSNGEGKIIQLVSNVVIDPFDTRHFSIFENRESKYYPSVAYTCSMAGVMALSRYLAAAYQDSGVIINNIIYSPIEDSMPEVLAQEYVKRVPMGRNLTTNDLSNAIDLLLDPKTSYITGQNIIIDGGVSIW